MARLTFRVGPSLVDVFSESFGALFFSLPFGFLTLFLTHSWVELGEASFLAGAAACGMITLACYARPLWRLAMRETIEIGDREVGQWYGPPHRRTHFTRPREGMTRVVIERSETVSKSFRPTTPMEQAAGAVSNVEPTKAVTYVYRVRLDGERSFALGSGLRRGRAEEIAEQVATFMQIGVERVGFE